MTSSSAANTGSSGSGTGGQGSGSGGVEFNCGSCDWIWTGTQWQLYSLWVREKVFGLSNSSLNLDAVVKCSRGDPGSCDCNQPGVLGTITGQRWITPCFEKLTSDSSRSSSSCSVTAAPCSCYVEVIELGGCPEYYCLSDELCCAGIFGQAFDGGNAATVCTESVDLGGANQPSPQLACSATCGTAFG